MNYADYARALRHELHMYPEIGYDLPKTLALIRRELEANGIEYTESFGKSSIVATLNPHCKGLTIGLRADIDALPIQEDSDLPWKSRIDGQGHMCGHDIHCANLLATGKWLKDHEDQLRCRVKLLFTPAEEYIEPGCKQLAENGVMDDIDFAIACHADPSYLVGTVGLSAGGQGSNSMGITLEFFGTAAHATAQKRGKDAITMAVLAHQAMHTMVAKELLPQEARMLNIGSIHGGNTNNIICDHCTMFASARTFTDESTQLLLDRITQIAEGVAAMQGGSAKVTVNKLLPFMDNDPTVTKAVYASAARALGEDKIFGRERKLGGEDFGFLARKKPCVMFRLGTKNPENPATGGALHSAKVQFDDGCFETGLAVMTQFVLDNQDGIAV